MVNFFSNMFSITDVFRPTKMLFALTLLPLPFVYSVFAVDPTFLKEFDRLIFWLYLPFVTCFSFEFVFSSSIMDLLAIESGKRCEFTLVNFSSTFTFSRFLEEAVGRLWWLLDLPFKRERIFVDYFLCISVF